MIQQNNERNKNNIRTSRQENIDEEKWIDYLPIYKKNDYKVDQWSSRDLS